jgi:hypothetical protein
MEARCRNSQTISPARATSSKRLRKPTSKVSVPAREQISSRLSSFARGCGGSPRWALHFVAGAANFVRSIPSFIGAAAPFVGNGEPPSKTTSMTETDEYLSPKQAMKLLGVSDGSINNWRNAGLLPYKLTPGGHYRYPKRAVLGLLRDPMEKRSRTAPGTKLVPRGVANRNGSKTPRKRSENRINWSRIQSVWSRGTGSGSV